MSIEIKIHEPPVTFGMLPVGSVFPFCSGWGFVVEGNADAPAIRFVDSRGVTHCISRDQDVDEYHLPPGAELARPKAKVVELQTLPQGAPFMDSAGDHWTKGAPIGAAYEIVRREYPHRTERVVGSTPVQPCRVEVHVWPEVEA